MNLRTIVVASVLMAIAAPASDRTLTGFTRDSSATELLVETKLSRLLDPRRVDLDFRELTREPHAAGTARNNELAGYVAESFRACPARHAPAK